MMNYNIIKICMIVLFFQSFQCSPADLPAASNFDSDAAALKKAMEGFGTDKAAIVDLLVKRSNAQRQEIKQAFGIRYGKNLINELKSELSGNLQNAVVALMLPNKQLYAKELHDSFVGVGTDDKSVAEILGPLDNQEIKDISSIYQNEYKTTLKDDLIAETSGSFQYLLVSLSKAKRNEGNANEINAIQDAHELIKATEMNSETNDTTYINILTTRSFSQLNNIFLEYKHLMNRDIVQSINNRFTGSLKNGFLAIVKSAIKKSDFFADQLHSALAGIGTNDRQLTRIIVGRSEKDLEDIKKSYEKLYSKPLIEKVASDTSGEYRNLLLSLLRK